MTLESKVEARQIVKEAGMSTRPEFYSGRGAIIDDLTDTHLEKVYDGIEQSHGKDAADQYAQMVADIPVLSATDFLLALYRLEGNKWNWDKSLLGTEKGVYATDEGTGMATIFGVLTGDRARDQTAHIRWFFLERHGIKNPDLKIYREYY